MWPHCHTLLPAANLITIPVKYISTDRVSAREDFNNPLLHFQPTTISISKWPRRCLGYIWFLFKRDKLLLKPDPHAEHMNSLLCIMRLRQFLSFMEIKNHSHVWKQPDCFQFHLTSQLPFTTCGTYSQVLGTGHLWELWFYLPQYLCDQGQRQCELTWASVLFGEGSLFL